MVGSPARGGCSTRAGPARELELSLRTGNFHAMAVLNRRLYLIGVAHDQDPVSAGAICVGQLLNSNSSSPLIPHRATTLADPMEFEMKNSLPASGRPSDPARITQTLNARAARKPHTCTRIGSQTRVRSPRLSCSNCARMAAGTSQGSRPADWRSNDRGQNPQIPSINANAPTPVALLSPKPYSRMTMQNAAVG